MHLAELKREIDALKEKVKVLNGLGLKADEVLVDTLDDFANRLTAIEHRLTEAGV